MFILNLTSSVFVSFSLLLSFLFLFVTLFVSVDQSCGFPTPPNRHLKESEATEIILNRMPIGAKEKKMTNFSKNECNYYKHNAKGKPSKLRFQFLLQNDTVNLLLYLDKISSFDDLPIYRIGKRENRLLYLPVSKHQYQEAASIYVGPKSLMSVKCKKFVIGNRIRTYFDISGMFTHKSKCYGIAPIEKQNDGKKNGQNFHLVYVLHEIKPGDVNFFSYFNAVRRNIKKRGSVRKKRNPQKAFTVELGIVIDFSVYSFFLSMQSGDNMEQKTFDVVYSIKEYYAYMLSTINVVFHSLPDEVFSITVKCRSFFISDNASTSWWIESLHDQSSRVEAVSVWNRFTDWLQEQPLSNTLHYEDHILIITRHSLIQSSEKLLGYTLLLGMCTVNSTSIIQEKFGLYTGLAAAHELGHSLGVLHDGKNNTCDPADEFIMAPSLGPRENEYRLNRFKFSRCSYGYLKNNLHKMTCLLDFDAEVDTELKAFKEMKPGQRYSANWQCQMRFGTKSNIYNCRDKNIFNEAFCTNMWCDNGEGECLKIIPLEGTMCSPREWCKNGRCIYSNTTNIAMQDDEDCWLGDKLFYTTFRMPHVTCHEIVSQQPWYCYNQKFYKECCWTCAFFKYPHLHECEYGDRRTDCLVQNCVAYDFQKRHIDCCFTCRQRSMFDNT
ncbi:metalloprotease mig-17 [Octopus bimaculoides]|nr:metalloprotease mig-17 [Octopus bimaculoides]|eukprot:XP_014768561.1 PREDICTED: ADAM family mig-17-like [Octopus bimaculoides]